MPSWDYKCVACESTFTVSVPRYSQLARMEIACPKCHCPHVSKLPAAPNFTVTGYNAKNGYSK